MKPARIVLFLIVCLLGSLLVLTAVPASSRSSKPNDNGVQAFDQQVRSEKFWREAMKNAKPLKLNRGPRSASQLAPADEGGAPVVIPPTGSQGDPDDSLPKYVSYMRRQTLGGFPAVGFTRTEITDPSQSPFHRHGKIFFTQNGNSFVCSGTIVTAGNESVVATAGHCVFDEVSNVANSSTMFVPGYKDGNMPFGIWDGIEIFTTTQWTNGDLRYDVGFVRMETQAGQTIQDVHGSRGIAFNQSAAQLFDSFGYPASGIFNGERLYRCDSAMGYTDPQFTSPAPNAIGCDMNQGSSGGGWTINTASGEVVNSVNRYLYEAQRAVGLNLIFGPYFGSVAETVYNAAAGSTGTPTSTPTGGGTVDHFSNLSLVLRRHLKAKGTMSPTDGYMPCSRQSPVGIYRLINETTGRLVGSIHNTKNDGTYNFAIPDRKGRYFANVFPRDVDATNLCMQAQSALVRHRH